MAEGYAVGQVMAAAVTATKGTDNAKIISYLHSGVTLSTVQGPVKFDSQGKNGAAAAFIFQWQKDATYKQVLPLGSTGSVAIINPKPNWTKLARWHTRSTRPSPTAYSSAASTP